MEFSLFSFSYLIILISILISIIIAIKFPNYFRICYYAQKLPGQSIVPSTIILTLFSGKTLTEKTQIFFKEVGDHAPVFWPGLLPILFVSDAEIAQEIMCNPCSLNRVPTFVKYLEPVLGDSISTAKDLEWKRKRKILIKGFNPLILNKYFTVFLEKCEILTKCLEKELNQTTSFDFFDYVLKTSVDSVIASTMGVKTNFQENGMPLYENAIKNVPRLITERLINFSQTSDFLYRKMNTFNEMQEHCKTVWEVTKMVLTKRRKIRNEKLQIENDFENSLLNHVLNVNEKQFEFSDEQIMAELNSIIFAATETSALALSYTLLELGNDKNIQNKVYNEIVDIFGNSQRPIELEDLSQLIYMEMVLKETIRLYPSIPVISRYISKDIETGGVLIPKGSNVYISIFNIHRREKYWKNPLKYDPERFSTENMKNHHPHAYIPFSAGPRNCIGGKYSMMFMKAALVILLRKYEFHTNLNLNELKFTLKISLKLESGHQVTITPRKKVVY